MRLLNEHLSTTPKSIRFCSGPISISIDDDGAVCSRSDAVREHNAGIVYNQTDSELVIFEWNHSIHNGLRAYRTRHNGIEQLEILVFRDPGDNRLRITIGNTDCPDLTFSPEEEDELLDYRGRLPEIYESKVGYKVWDR